jgi:hypothetical protein
VTSQNVLATVAGSVHSINALFTWTVPVNKRLSSPGNETGSDPTEGRLVVPARAWGGGVPLRPGV